VSDSSDRSRQVAALLEAIPVPAAVAHDREAREVAINSAFGEVLGVTPGQFASAMAGDAGTMPFAYECDGIALRPEQLPLARAARGETVRDMRIDVVRADGARRTILGSASPLYAGEAAPAGALCIFQDSAELRAERASEAMRSIGSIATFVTEETNVPAMLAGVSAIAFTGLADICFFDLRANDGSIERHVEVAPDVDREVRDLVLGVAPPVRAFRAEHPFPLAAMRGETIHVARADDDWRRDAAATTAIEDLWRRVGYHSIICVPLDASGRTLGSLTMLRTKIAAPFDAVDVGVAQEIGRRVGLAIQKASVSAAGKHDTVRREAEFRTLADVMPQMMWVADSAGMILWRNRRWSEYTGLAEGAPEYGSLMLHPAERDAVRRLWAARQRTGEPFESEHRIRGRDGTYRWFLSRATCVRDDAGNIERWYGSNTDVDDRRRAGLTLQLFAKLGQVLSESLGLQSTLEAAMECVVPDFADWSFVNLLDESGDLRVQAVYHADAEKNFALRALIGERYARGETTTGAADDDAERIVESNVLDTLLAVGFSSVLVVPLFIGTTLRGTLNVAMNDPEREFGEDDVPFFRELARRLVPAITNAELYERERRVAQTFQQAALPTHLPDRLGFTFDAIYEAGQSEALIGGDWYDAFPLVDGRIVVSIGDVAGSGLEAAVTMANMRQAIRGVAQVHADPALMLEAADRTLRAEAPERFVTAFVGVLDGVGHTLAYASAGHPPPLVRYDDGTIAQLAYGGPPLGLREHVRGGGHTLPIPENVFFVFYTDGLIESTHDMDEGERRLRAALVHPAVVASAKPASAIYRAVLVEGSRDDVAILTVSIGRGSELAHWAFDALDAAAARGAQHQLRERLAAMHVTLECSLSAELAIAELIGNTVRYAPGPIEILLESVGGRTVAHVLDRGPGFEFAAKLPPDVFSESGRGLFLVSAFSDDFSVVRRPGGGSHARVVLAGTGV
jgi:PAS domain S-box-containing protein